MLIGVKKIKYIKKIIIGVINLPKISPNSVHAIFKGVKNDELSNPKIKKGIDNIKKPTFTVLLLSNGHKPIIKNIIKNNNPKLLLLLLFFIIYSLYRKQLAKLMPEYKKIFSKIFLRKKPV